MTRGKETSPPSPLSLGSQPSPKGRGGGDERRAGVSPVSPLSLGELREPRERGRRFAGGEVPAKRGLPILPSADTSRAQREEDGPSAPPWAHQPTVEWQVVGQCNYDCSYCIQSKKYRVGIPTDDSLRASLRFLSSLPVDDGRAWEVKTTGGEPFSFRSFLDLVVPGLMDTPHTMSTLTNLSAPPKTLARFAALTRGRLQVVSASLHLEHTTSAAFLDRLEGLRDDVDDSTRIVVNCVLVPDESGSLDAVKQARDDVVGRGFRFFPQLMKVKGGVFAYSVAQMAQVKEIVGDLALAAQTRSANLAPAYTGQRCWAGARYLVLTKEGDAYSCRTAKRFDEGFLGNVHTSVRLNGGPRACRYPICPCAVPANRGMIEGVTPSSLVNAGAIDGDGDDG